MKMFVKYNLFSQLVGKTGEKIRKDINNKIFLMERHNKMLGGAAFIDSRGGYLILDVNSHDDLFETLGNQMLANCKVEMHPLMDFKD